MKTLNRAFVFSFVFSTACYAGDYIIEHLPPHLESRVQLQSVALLGVPVGNIDDYFISRLKLWDNSSSIKVCFFGDSNQLKGKIAKIASEWAAVGGKVPLDFGSTPSYRTCNSADFSHIRIGYQYKGYWSLVGTDSINLASQLEQSMNFQLFDISPPEDGEFRRVVLHEFGHALGFQHEHQSYKSDCVLEFDWEAIYKYLQGPPNYWSIEQIYHNLKPKPASSEAISSPFDTKSIMLYSFPRSFYKSDNPKCYTQGNNTISNCDKDAIIKFYPNTSAGSQLIRQQALANFSEKIEALQASAFTKSVAKSNAASIFSSTIGPNFLGPNAAFNLPTGPLTLERFRTGELNYLGRRNSISPM